MVTIGNVKAYTENLTLRLRELERLKVLLKTFPDNPELLNSVKDMETQYLAAAALLMGVLHTVPEL